MIAELGVPELKGLASRIRFMESENSGLSNDRSLVDSSTSLVDSDRLLMAELGR
jgi:hypothetical protein